MTPASTPWPIRLQGLANIICAAGCDSAGCPALALRRANFRLAIYDHCQPLYMGMN